MTRAARTITTRLMAMAALLAASAAAADRTATFRADANVVLINATVLDRHNRPVRGLNRGDFRLSEGKREQTVSYFSEEEVPLSLAVVFDTSGSMDGKISRAREALAAMLRDSGSGDEFSLITFGDRPRVAVPWTGDAGEIQADVLFAKPEGATSLLDAVAMAVDETRRARNPRRAVLILSDGGDNHSRYSEGHMVRLLEEANVEVYAIDMSGDGAVRALSREEFDGPELLERLCDDAGGRYLRVDGAKELATAATQIARELRSQYVLGYKPADAAEDGRFHAVKLQMTPGAGASKLTVYWRRGYRAAGGRALMAAVQ